VSPASRPAWAAAATDLTGKTVVVVGAAGGVGEGVVATLLRDGATVIAAGRDKGRLDDLATRIGTEGIPARRLHLAPLDALASDLDERAASLAREHGPFDGFVASVAAMGDQGRRPALELTDAQFQALLDANLTSVFRLLRAFVPRVAPDGAVIQLNGMSAEIPFPGMAGRALAAAAVRSLMRTLAAETGDAGPRVYEVILGMVRTRARQQACIDDPGWLHGTEIGVHVSELVAGTGPLAAEALHYFTDKAAGPRLSPGPSGPAASPAR
jgi:NAD(P)-dependent dehydrogenase (short-subunit alcohol dehydrogenase family)